MICVFTKPNCFKSFLFEKKFFSGNKATYKQIPMYGENSPVHVSGKKKKKKKKDF
jgi:hypothetical protein